MASTKKFTMNDLIELVASMGEGDRLRLVMESKLHQISLRSQSDAMGFFARMHEHAPGEGDWSRLVIDAKVGPGGDHPSYGTMLVPLRVD